MEMDKKNGIDEIMNSLDGIKTAEPGAFLYTRIIGKINLVKEEYTPVKMVWLAAASFILLLALNLKVIRGLNAGHNEQASVRELAAQYHLLNTNTINYNE